MSHLESLARYFTETLELPADAAMWLLDLWHMAQVFDDVADGDPVARADLDRAVWKGLVAMPSNPFFTAHLSALQPAMATAILKWKASDDAERAGRADARSFVWRAGYYDVVLAAVAAHCGSAGALALADKVLSLYGETLEDYLKEFPSCPPL